MPRKISDQLSVISIRLFVICVCLLFSLSLFEPSFVNAQTPTTTIAAQQSNPVQNFFDTIIQFINPKFNNYDQMRVPGQLNTNPPVPTGTNNNVHKNNVKGDFTDPNKENSFYYSVGAAVNTPEKQSSTDIGSWLQNIGQNIGNIFSNTSDESRAFVNVWLPPDAAYKYSSKDKSFPAAQCAGLPAGSCGADGQPKLIGAPNLTPQAPVVTISVTPPAGLVYYCQRDPNPPNNANNPFDTSAPDGTQCTYLKGGCGIFTVAMILSTYKKDKSYYPDYVSKNYYPNNITGCVTDIGQANDILTRPEFNFTTKYIFTNQYATFDNLSASYKNDMINWLNSGSGILAVAVINNVGHILWITGIQQQGSSYILEVMDPYYGCFKPYPLSEGTPGIILTWALAFTP